MKPLFASVLALVSVLNLSAADAPAKAKMRAPRAANPAMARILGFESPAELIELRTDIENEHYVDPASRIELSSILAEDAIKVAVADYKQKHEDMVRTWSAAKTMMGFIKLMGGVAVALGALYGLARLVISHFIPGTAP